MERKITREQMGKLQSCINAIVTRPIESNIGIIDGRFDLEIVIRVAEVDKPLFTETVISLLKHIVKQMTNVSAPVMYLEGQMPEELRIYLVACSI